MQLFARLLAVLLLVWSVRAVSALPGRRDRFSIQRSSREQIEVRKGLILKRLAELLDGNDMTASSNSDDPLEEDLSKLDQRDRKDPCNHFYWKTFTNC